MICAIEDMFDPATDPGIRWHNGNNTTTGATAKPIGTGQANTALIVSVYGTPTAQNITDHGGYAAYACDVYSYGIYSDWFLPSELELVEMWNQKTILNSALTSIGGEILDNIYYWSSSELAFSTARGFNMGHTGTYGLGLKSFQKASKTDGNNGKIRVRPIRAF